MRCNQIEKKSVDGVKNMKKRTAIFNLIIVFIIFQTSSVAYSDVITLVADKWCPYNCTPKTKLPGFIIEIARYAFERAGHTIEYDVVPWARAIKKTRAGVYDGIVGTGSRETPDFIFPEYELGFAAHTFYVKKGKNWNYTGLKSLDQISIGVIRDYSYGDLYNTYIKFHQDDESKVQIVSGETGLGQNISKLLINRIDALIEDRTVFQYHLYKTKTPNDFLEVGVAYTEKVYIAFSPLNKNAKMYANILSNSMNELRASKKLNEILGRYGVKDWVE